MRYSCDGTLLNLCINPKDRDIKDYLIIPESFYNIAK